MNKTLKALTLIFTVLLFASCATVGKDFRFPGPTYLKVGETTEKDILSILGDPFRVGQDNGKTQWTYGHYKYSLFGESETKDLVLTFNQERILDSYTYGTSVPNERDEFLKK